MTELENFHEELYNDVNARATSGQDFFQRTFFDVASTYLNEASLIEPPEYAYYKDAQGRSISGYQHDDNELGNGALNLYISTYTAQNTISNLNKEEISTVFKRLEKFYLTSSKDRKFYEEMEESSDGYKAARAIYDKRNSSTCVNLYLLTDKRINTRLESLPSKELDGVVFNYHLWDLSKLYTLISSEKIPEEITINFKEMFGESLPCLPVNIATTEYEAYLSVIPGTILAKLYKIYGARLLERNVRTFLQARGKVNKGIRATILQEPEHFFAYNNGITAIAESIELEDNKIVLLTGLQIVNGGQTTASLFNAYKKDEAELDDIYVQMKLSVVPQTKADEMVPLISKYANSQNKVNDADFSATHAFHQRMQNYSRRTYAPAQQGELQQTKWFYERARGQYINEFAYREPADKKKKQIEFPKKQLLTKTDLAKFDGVWRQKPEIISKGAQYIFSDYTDHIAEKWEQNEALLNQNYYKLAIAKAIIFRASEKIVTNAEWYDGGYRANIVAYSLSYTAYKVEEIKKSIDFIDIWNKQSISSIFKEYITLVAENVRNLLLNNGINSNIGQYCKQVACWKRVQELNLPLADNFIDELIDNNEIKAYLQSEKTSQKMENSIGAEISVSNIPLNQWIILGDFIRTKKLLAPQAKEIGVLDYYIKNKFVSSKQANVLLRLLDRMKGEGFKLD